MIDKDKDFKITIHTTKAVKEDVTAAAKRKGMFESEIGERAIKRCIRLDNAPAWKRCILKLLGL